MVTSKPKKEAFVEFTLVGDGNPETAKEHLALLRTQITGVKEIGNTDTTLIMVLGGATYTVTGTYEEWLSAIWD